jgi:hypothetical protein
MSKGQAEMDGVLAVDECWALLRGAEIGRLALIIAGKPEIFPLNFVVDHGTIVFRSAPGTKLSSSSEHPTVAFETDGFDEAGFAAWSVVVQGQLRPLVSTEPLDTLLPLFPLHPGSKPRFMRIVPDAISGRRFLVTHGSQSAVPRFS